MKRPCYCPVPDPTEPRDEELAGRDDGGKWSAAPWWTGIMIVVIAVAVAIVGGALFGLGRAMGFWIYWGLTGDRP